MHGFEANNCRKCQKVFCCKKCRTKHEKNVHEIFPACDICVYGNFFLENFDDGLLQHLESSHLPLHCLYCKKNFNSIEDLLQHKRCRYFENKEVSPKTPFKAPPALVISVNSHDSPIQELQTQDYILATSTPMHRIEEPNVMFEKSKEVITPVDKSLRIINSKSIIKKTDSAKSDDNLSKRRVTFGDTPSLNPSEKIMKGNATENENNSGNAAEAVLDGEFLSQKPKEENFTPEGNITENEDNSDNAAEAALDGQFLSQQPQDENFTPVTGMSTGQFYSAKTETQQFYSAKTELSSTNVRENSNGSSYVKNLSEGFTPVGVTNKSKIINVKGGIYKEKEPQINGCSEIRNNNTDNTNQDNLQEIHMELTPAKSFKSVEKFPNVNEVGQGSLHNYISPTVENGGAINKCSLAENELDFSTPAKTSNPGKTIRNGNVYTPSDWQELLRIAKATEENRDDQITFKNTFIRYKTDKVEIVTMSNTQWSSALNFEDSNDLEPNDEKKQPADKRDAVQEENVPPDSTRESPQREDQKTVSIVMPTPILKTTNVLTKFKFPAYLSSTPLIVSRDPVKLKQTRIIKNLSNKVIQPQTPYKTPEGKLCNFLERKLVDSNSQRNTDTLSAIEAGPSTAGKDIVPFKGIKENDSSRNSALCNDVVRGPINEHYEDSYSSLPSQETKTSISVSSMTESSLWTSMTRIVKSVFGGFTGQDQGSSNIYFNNNSSGFKRQLSDSDTGDIEAPRLKRFKFTDIKCRRAIRDLPVLQITQRLPRPLAPLANIEIVKSVSTVYNQQTVIIKCDKATQTDNYLLYGWRPTE